MGCATGTVKYLVFLFNLVVVLVGLVLLVVGIISFISAKEMTEQLDEKYLTHVPLIIIILGSIIFFIAFLGCCGAIRENTCMLLLYAIILLLLFTLQVGAGVYSFLNVKDKDNESLRETINIELQRVFEKTSTSNDSMEFFNVVQKSLECCGVKGPNDWKPSSIPGSCCKELETGKTCMINDAFGDGCGAKLADSLISSAKMLGYVSLGLCVTELVAAIFALCLHSSIRNESRRGYYA